MFHDEKKNPNGFNGENKYLLVKIVGSCDIKALASWLFKLHRAYERPMDLKGALILARNMRLKEKSFSFPKTLGYGYPVVKSVNFQDVVPDGVEAKWLNNPEYRSQREKDVKSSKIFENNLVDSAILGDSVSAKTFLLMYRNQELSEQEKNFYLGFNDWNTVE